jgi:endonuclease-3
MTPLREFQKSGVSIACMKKKAYRISGKLHEIYGSPNHNNKKDPLDELFFILLSQMTTHQSFNRVYERFKSKIGPWENLLETPVRKIASLIKNAGLSNQKAPRIKAIANRLKADHGFVSLGFLSKMDNHTGEQYLATLPGVGIKTAKCVLMYSLNRSVLPVDTHVKRVSERVGFLTLGLSPSKVHEEIEKVVPKSQRFSIHVNGIVHGRTYCHPHHPKCKDCPLSRMCAFHKQRQAQNI